MKEGPSEKIESVRYVTKLSSLSDYIIVFRWMSHCSNGINLFTNQDFGTVEWSYNLHCYMSTCRQHPLVCACLTDLHQGGKYLSEMRMKFAAFQVDLLWTKLRWILPISTYLVSPGQVKLHSQEFLQHSNGDHNRAEKIKCSRELQSKSKSSLNPSNIRNHLWMYKVKKPYNHIIWTYSSVFHLDTASCWQVTTEIMYYVHQLDLNSKVMSWSSLVLLVDGKDDNGDRNMKRDIAGGCDGDDAAVGYWWWYGIVVDEDTIATMMTMMVMMMKEHYEHTDCGLNSREMLIFSSSRIFLGKLTGSSSDVLSVLLILPSARRVLITITYATWYKYDKGDPD